jgi:hypothetical protein
MVSTGIMGGLACLAIGVVAGATLAVVIVRVVEWLCDLDWTR